MSKKPIKRSSELITLSREHHYSLLFSWKITKGLKNNIPTERIIRYVRHFWEHHLQQHFKQEQVVLFHKVKDDLLVKEVWKEQEETAQKIAAIIDGKENSEAQRAALETLATMITTLVRKEERDLFPEIEQSISGQALVQAAKELEHMQPEPLQDDYDDEFWV